MFDCESWIIKKAEHWRIDAFELWCWRRLFIESLGEIQPIHPKGDQSWIFTGKSDAETETPILWPHDAKIWLIGKDPDAGKDWRQEEKDEMRWGWDEDEMVGWHHWLDEHEFEQAQGVGDEQGRLECCSPRGRRVRYDWVTELNWSSNKKQFILHVS